MSGTRILRPNIFAGSSLSIPFAPAGGFIPVGSPILWLKADTLALSNGDPVASWTDQSGQNNHAAQGTEGRKPEYVASTATLNNLPSVLFVRANVDQMFFATFTNAASDYTFFFACDPTLGTSLVNCLFDTTTGRLALSMGKSATDIEYWDVAAQGTKDGVDEPQVVTYSLKAPNLGAIYKNSDALDTGLDYTQRAIGGAVVTLGGYINDAANFQGNIAEVIVYNSALSDADRNLNIDGLKTKYGIT
jgi:hypothetical protein